MSLNNENDALKQEKKKLFKNKMTIQRGIGKEELSFHQQNKEMPYKAAKTKSNSKFHQADEIDTLILNNQFQCIKIQQIDFTIEINDPENINTKRNTGKVGNKIKPKF